MSVSPKLQPEAPSRRSRTHAMIMVAVLMAATVAQRSTALAAEFQPDLWPSAPAPLPGMEAADAEAQQLLAGMTLEEKVGQMIQADIASISPAQLTQYRLGSLLAGGGAAPGNDVRATPEAWLQLTDSYFRASLAAATAAHRPIPILFGIDAVHGNAKIPGATIFPHNVGLGAAHDPQLMRSIGEATAAEVTAIGADWTFAPTVAVVRDPRWGRSYESYSESPELVAQYAAQMIQGLQGSWGSPGFLRPPHTLASVKHYLGDGSTLDGRDQGDSEVSEATLAHVHAAGYPAAIGAGALIVMASYNSWRGVKLHASHYLLTDILKQRMGFAGFVVGDWNAHEQIPGCTKFDCPAAYLAGIDMLMAPDSWHELYEHTIAEVRSGRIPGQRVDDAVRRILRVKVLSGLLDRQAPLDRAAASPLSALGSPAHRALARRAVRESLVLLKNERGVLPLPASSHVLVVGKAADDIGIQSGGWSIDWQGDHNLNADFPGATSILAGIRSAVAAGGGSVEYSRYGDWQQRPDAAIVVYGEQPYAEFQGDRETLQFSPEDSYDLDVLRRLKSAHVPVVSVFISGRPMWVNPELNASDAFVAAWLPGSEGEGLADVLFRSADGAIAHDFTGRLGFSWPRTAMPVRFDDAQGRIQGALFERGYGLSYGHLSHVAQLDEDPRVPPERREHDTLYHAAHVTAPWSIYLTDAGAAVRVTGERQDSPQGGLSVRRTSEGLDATWHGSVRSMLEIAGRPADYSPRARPGAAIELRYRLSQAPGEGVQIGIVCAPAYERHPAENLGDGTPGTNAGSRAGRCGTDSGALLDFTNELRATPAGQWHTLTYSFACFADRGADLANLQAPLAIEASGHVALQIGEVRLVTRKGPPHCGAG